MRSSLKPKARSLGLHYGQVVVGAGQFRLSKPRCSEHSKNTTINMRPKKQMQQQKTSEVVTAVAEQVTTRQDVSSDTDALATFCTLASGSLIGDGAFNAALAWLAN